MNCSKCGIRNAHIAIIDLDGHFYEDNGEFVVFDDNVFCCWCFALDMNEKLKEAEKAKKARDN